jgi:hypothetical protein
MAKFPPMRNEGLYISDDSNGDIVACKDGHKV